jgi:hypothetical protein
MNPVAFYLPAAAALLLHYSPPASAWSVGDYGPFQPGREPAAYPMRTIVDYSRDEVQDAERHILPAGAPSGRSLLFELKHGKATLCVVSAQGEPLMEPAPISAPWHMSGCRTGDINGDDIPDWVVTQPSYGVGLSGDIYFVSFVLSTDHTYSVRTLRSATYGHPDFVDLNQDGRPEYVHTILVHGYGELCRDGKRHNFWVHNLLQFQGPNITSANHLDPRFPAWIWYTFKPNHQNTTLLKPEQKIRLFLNTWPRYQPLGPIIHPNSDSLTNEQGG